MPIYSFKIVVLLGGITCSIKKAILVFIFTMDPQQKSLRFLCFVINLTRVIGVELNILEFLYQCGRTLCTFPHEYCSEDRDVPDQSQCGHCTSELCTIQDSPKFPRACSIFCNGEYFCKKCRQSNVPIR